MLRMIYTKYYMPYYAEACHHHTKSYRAINGIPHKCILQTVCHFVKKGYSATRCLLPYEHPECRICFFNLELNCTGWWEMWLASIYDYPPPTFIFSAKLQILVVHLDGQSNLKASMIEPRLFCPTPQRINHFPVLKFRIWSMINKFARDEDHCFIMQALHQMRPQHEGLLCLLEQTTDTDISRIAYTTPRLET